MVVAARIGANADLEIAVAPLRGPRGVADRLLGLYAPAATLTLAETEPRLLTARACTGAGRPGRPPLTVISGRKVA